jgi:hypothetical protein
MLKCLIIIPCQCYLYTITVSSINYVRVLQSRFETSFLPLKKRYLPSHVIYDRTYRLCTSYPTLREYLSAVHLSACISVMRRRRQLWLIVRSTYLGNKECSGMRPDQSHGTIHSSTKYATTGGDRGAEVVANPTGATVFHRPVSQC